MLIISLMIRTPRLPMWHWALCLHELHAMTLYRGGLVMSSTSELWRIKLAGQPPLLTARDDIHQEFSLGFS